MLVGPVQLQMTERLEQGSVANMVCRQTPDHPVIIWPMNFRTESIFFIFEWLKRRPFRDMQKLFEIHISLSINKVLLEHCYVHWLYGCFHLTVVELSSCDRDYTYLKP